MSIWLVCQDADCIYKRTDEELCTMPRYNNGILYGFNLFLGDDKFLGTFDSLEDAQKEMTDILEFRGEYFRVSGFADYDGEADFESLCAYVDALEDYDEPIC